MCIICIDYQKNELQPYEALHNLEEMKNEVGEQHYEDLREKISDDILQTQLDEYWEIVGFGD